LATVIRVCLADATGWVGRPLSAAIQSSPDLTLSAAVARRGRGERLGDISISGSVEDALRTPSDASSTSPIPATSRRVSCWLLPAAVMS
jgi:dihydrodipicolinate reductase